MNEMMLKEDVYIENMIYDIRGKQVMIDRDLVGLYGCTNGTKDINKAVKRNLERFPENFYIHYHLNNRTISRMMINIITSFRR